MCPFPAAIRSPLPVPVLMEDELPVGYGRQEEAFHRWWRHLVDWAERMLPVTIFLPTLGAVESFGRFYSRFRAKPIPLDWVHTGHPHRDRMVRISQRQVADDGYYHRLGEGTEFPGFRSWCHADDEQVFDTECLVQIAGRGKDGMLPIPAVKWSLSVAKSPGQCWRRKMDREMNKRPNKLGCWSVLQAFKETDLKPFIIHPIKFWQNFSKVSDCR